MTIRRVFWILFLLNLFNYIDRQVLYAIFPLIQADLHLADWQLGVLASVFMTVYMCYAPVVGYLAGRVARSRLIAVSALVWSAATLACGAAKNFAHLLLARGFIGVGEGGFTTIAQPFLAEHQPPEKHALLLALFGLALPVGSALGYVLGGVLGKSFGWRLAFMAVSIPGMFLALLSWFLPEGAGHSVTQAKPPQWQEYGQLFKNRPFLYVCLIQTVTTFLLGGFSAWVPTYLFRYTGLDVAQAGVWFGGLVIAGGAIGTVTGGKLAQKWLKKSSRAYYRVMLVSLLGALGPMWLGLWVTNMYAVLACFGAAIVFLFLPTGAIAAALVAETPPATRTMAFAVNIFIIHLLGDAFSPVLIGVLSNTWNLKTALWICTAAVLPGIGACRLAGKAKH